MNTKNIFVFALFTAVVSSACVSLTVSDDNVCDQVTLNGTVPVSPVAGVTLPPTTLTDTVNFSSTVSKVSNVADQLTANVNQLTLSNNGDLNWVNQVDVQVQGTTNDTPQVDFATYAKTGTPGSIVDVQVKMSSDQLLHYLQSGPLTLTFTISGTAPTVAVNLQNTVCVAVSGHFSKSL